MAPCVATDGSVAPGVWELTLNVEGEFMAGTWTTVGPDFEPWEVVVTNDLDDFGCYLYIAPFETPFWGPDVLAPAEILAPGGTVFVSPPKGAYDTLALDCDTTELYRGVAFVPEDALIVIG